MCSFWHGAICAQNVGPLHHQKKASVRWVLADAECERQIGADHRCQHEALYKKELEFVRHSNDLHEKSDD